MLELRLAAWERWQAAAGRWRLWATCPALVAPEIDGVALKSISEIDFRPWRGLVDDLAHQLTRGRTAVALDLEPSLGVRVAAELNRRGFANAVLVLPRWPYAKAVLPVDELLETLIVESRTLRTSEAQPNVVFVLDADRSRPVRRRAGEEPADNRYHLALADLPDLVTFRTAGIDRIVKLTPA